MTPESEPEQKPVDKKINRLDFLLFTKLMEMVRLQGEIIQIIMEKTLYGDENER